MQSLILLFSECLSWWWACVLLLSVNTIAIAPSRDYYCCLVFINEKDLNLVVFTYNYDLAFAIAIMYVCHRKCNDLLFKQKGVFARRFCDLAVAIVLMFCCPQGPNLVFLCMWVEVLFLNERNVLVLLKLIENNHWMVQFHWQHLLTHIKQKALVVTHIKGSQASL